MKMLQESNFAYIVLYTIALSRKCYRWDITASFQHAFVRVDQSGRSNPIIRLLSVVTLVRVDTFCLARQFEGNIRDSSIGVFRRFLRNSRTAIMNHIHSIRDCHSDDGDEKL